MVCAVSAPCARSRHSARRETTKHTTMIRPQRHDPFGLCDEDGGRQEHGICEKTTSSFDATVLCGGRRECVVRKFSGLQDGGANHPPCLPKRFLLDLLQIDGSRRDDVPLLFPWAVLCARSSPAGMTSMGHQCVMDVSPCRFPFLFPVHRGLGVGFTGKAAMTQMPPCLHPLGLRTLHQTLQTGLGALW
jgi:hypothetical protein